MRRVFFLIVGIFFSLSVHSQYTVSQDTTSNLNNELTFDYTIAGDLSQLDSISIVFSSLSSTDTLSLFNGVYIAEEDDPSSFVLFDFDDDSNVINLRIGSFEYSDFLSIIKIRKLDGTLEEFSFN